MKGNQNPQKEPFGTIWQRIISHSGATFNTARGLSLTYKVHGSYLITSRTKYNLSKADFERAWQMMLGLKWADISKKIHGPSYVKAILTDPRISGNKPDKQQHLFPDEYGQGKDPLPIRPPPKKGSSQVLHNTNKGRTIASVLYEGFRTAGIHGMHDLPEDEPPSGVKRGTLEHIIFLTFTVAIDYQRDAHALWDAARSTWEDFDTRFLFDPVAVSEAPAELVLQAMRKHRLSKKHKSDAIIWRRVAGSFAGKWEGDPRNFLADCGWDAFGSSTHSTAST